MNLIFSTLFVTITVVYVVLRNKFVHIPWQEELIPYAGTIGGMLVLGLVFDIIWSRFLEKFKINKVLFGISVLFLLLALLLYWTTDIAKLADYTKLTDPPYIPTDINASIPPSINNYLTSVAFYLGIIVSAILAPLIFRNSISISLVIFILGAWVQSPAMGSIFTIGISLIIYLGLGLSLKMYSKWKAQTTPEIRHL